MQSILNNMTLDDKQESLIAEFRKLTINRTFNSLTANHFTEGKDSVSEPSVEAFLNSALTEMRKAVIKEIEKLKIGMPSDFGMGYLYINRKKYLVERDSKEFRMVIELAVETNKKIEKLLSQLESNSERTTGE